jgi:hypothetical protein
LFHSLQSYVFS